MLVGRTLSIWIKYRRKKKKVREIDHRLGVGQEVVVRIYYHILEYMPRRRYSWTFQTTTCQWARRHRFLAFCNGLFHVSNRLRFKRRSVGHNTEKKKFDTNDKPSWNLCQMSSMANVSKFSRLLTARQRDACKSNNSLNSPSSVVAVLVKNDHTEMAGQSARGWIGRRGQPIISNLPRCSTAQPITFSIA